MEVAGLVLGAIPLAITALKCYKTGRRLIDLMRNRKRHIEALIRALESYENYLKLILEWLLKSAKVYDEMNFQTQSHAAMLVLRDPIIVEKMKECLGPNYLPAFQDAIENGQQVVEKIVMNINDLLPGSQVSALDKIKLKHSADIEFQFRKGIRLTLRQSEIDDQARALTENANELDRIHNVGDKLYQLNATRGSSGSQRLATSLGRVRRHADRLYATISGSWTSKCHPAHEAKLMLENRVDEVLEISSKKKYPAVRFRVVFTSESSAGSNMMWHESDIKVDDIEADEDLDVRPADGAPLRQIPIRVTFSSLPREFDIRPDATEVEDICLTISKAKREQKRLQLYLNTQCRFRCHHTADPEIHSVSSQTRNTISLEALLSASIHATDPSKRMPLRSRLFLALNLTSTLIQLNVTPWLARTWSKSTVRFLAPSASLNCSQIDLSRPLISVKFDSEMEGIGHIKCPEARQMILELGIMLLELWHETTLEAYWVESNVTVGNDYFERVAWAQKWLEASIESVLPDYAGLVARCIKCNFGHAHALNPAWESDKLVEGLIIGVLEPLQSLCKGSRG